MKYIIVQVLTAIVLLTVLLPDKEAALQAGPAVFAKVTESTETATENEEENPFFRNVKVEGKRGKYKITGDARPATGRFFYTVEDGHVQLIDETKGKTKSKYPEWESFVIHISLDEKILPKNGVLMLNLYERSKEGEIIHLYPVVLEKFVPPSAVNQF